METKYSKTQFDGYTHRFVVRFQVDDDFRNDSVIHIYSDSESYQELEIYINTKKSEKVVNFKIENRASKEQDDAESEMIDSLHF